MRKAIGVCLVSTLVLGAGCARVHSNPPTSHPPTERPTVQQQRPLFAFHSNFWINLHERLGYESSPWRIVPRVPSIVPPDTRAGRKFSPEEQTAWASSLEMYRKIFPREAGPPKPNDPFELAARELTVLEETADISTTKLPAELAAALEAAAKVYRHHDWPIDDAGNRDWIAKIKPLVERLGMSIAADLERIYGSRWPDDPLRVDISAYAGLRGAYTTEVAGAPRITITSSEPGQRGELFLETLFHEASHVLMHPLAQSISLECVSQGKRASHDFLHALLFYSTGQTVRSKLDPTYQPHAYRNGLFARQPSADWEVLFRQSWQPYLDGQIDVRQAVSRLVAGLG